MKILGFAGSLRKDSHNKLALKIVLNYAKQTGAEIEFVDLADYDIPLYNRDLETEVQIPKDIDKLREKISEADGLVIAAPEYNHSISGVLKNTLDWLSRTRFAPSVLAKKPTAFFGVSDGQFGTVRSQIAFFPIANTLGLYLMPSKVYVSNGPEKFDEEGNLNDEKTDQKLKELAENFVEFAEIFKKSR